MENNDSAASGKIYITRVIEGMTYINQSVHKDLINRKEKEIATLKNQLKREMDCVDFYANGNGGNEDDSEMMPASNECPFAGEQLGRYARDTQKKRKVTT